MLTIADEEGEGFCQMLTIADKGGGDFCVKWVSNDTKYIQVLAWTNWILKEIKGKVNVEN